ncbi:MAG: alpha/beta hydrolase [Henriciella sp.]|nr:alpha/beta hydrolase [Henriciella sp.]
MSFEDTLRKFTEQMKMPAFPDDWKGSIDGLRESFYRASRSVERDLPNLAEMSNLIVDGADGPLKARLYVPLGAGIAPAPAILFFHGGGFVLGDLDSHDIICRRLAAGSHCRVLSIDYRLAPESKFPAAHADALAAWTWATERGDMLGFDPDRIAVAGDSAGGNLAAFICQETNRTGQHMPAFQLLLYPLVQFVDIRKKKLTFQEGGFFLTPNLFDYFRDNYIENDTDRMDPRVSPLFADDAAFAGLPPAHMVLCGWDPLKDEGQAYVSKLAAHGVSVTVREHAGMVHGFMNMTAFSTTVREAIHDAGVVVGKALGSI